MHKLQVGQTVELRFKSHRTRRHPVFLYRVSSVRDDGESDQIVEASCPGIGSIRFRWETRPIIWHIDSQQRVRINGRWYYVRQARNGT